MFATRKTAQDDFLVSLPGPLGDEVGFGFASGGIGLGAGGAQGRNLRADIAEVGLESRVSLQGREHRITRDA